MHIEQMYTSCLAQAAYYIESNGEAAIVDPIRDIEVYLDMARERGTVIKYIFETHFHADFVSGHVDLARLTGAKIIYGPGAETGFECKVATDGEIFPLGNVSFKAIHTPGHTPESTCFLLYDENGKESSLFSGDTVFVGDVGRPDLCQAGASLTQEDMAGMMYESLHNKIMPLADDIILYPAHGPGSACGKNLGPETMSTLGREKQLNYAFQPMTREAFVDALCDGIAPPPPYFFEDAALNKNGYAPIEDIIEGARSLSAEELATEIQNGTVVIDTRIADEFENGYVKGAINIGLNGQYAIWAATLFDLDRRIAIVAKTGTEKESIVRLTRVGFSNICGFLHDGIETWYDANKPIDMVISITDEEFALDQKYGTAAILDVRRPGEWANGIVKEAKLLNLENLQSGMTDLDKTTEMHVHCAGGYRSMIAVSMLKANGFDKVKNVYGGYNSIKESGVEIVVPEEATA